MTIPNNSSILVAYRDGTPTRGRYALFLLDVMKRRAKGWAIIHSEQRFVDYYDGRRVQENTPIFFIDQHIKKGHDIRQTFELGLLTESYKEKTTRWTMVLSERCLQTISTGLYGPQYVFLSFLKYQAGP